MQHGHSMGDTTRVDSGGTVRLKPRYWFMVLLLVLPVAVWPTWHVTLPPGEENVVGGLTRWQAAGLFGMLWGGAVFIIALMDRLRTGRGMRQRGDNRRVIEAYQIARANFVLSTIVPLSVLVAMTVRQLPPTVLQGIEAVARWLFPNLPSRL